MEVMLERISVKSLENLVEILKEAAPTVPKTTRLTSRELELVQKGVILAVDFEDMVMDTEHRGGYRLSSLLKELANHFKIPIRHLYHKPRYANGENIGWQGFTAPDAVHLLILLESLGLCVNPERLVNKLITTLKNKDMLTTSELAIWEYPSQRHKCKIHLRSDLDATQHAWTEQRFKGENGYRFILMLINSQPYKLEAIGPKQRNLRPRVEVTCDYCGVHYTKGDLGSSLVHRREHARIKRILEPRPSSRFSKRLLNHPDPELVDGGSPLWMHDEVYERALQFKRDFRYDSLQWNGNGQRKASPNFDGYLFSERSESLPTGTVAGACAFILRKNQWTLYWIWVAPNMRRTGVLSARWAAFLERYGDFNIEWPLSEAMTGFVRKAGTPRQKASLLDLEKR